MTRFLKGKNQIFENVQLIQRQRLHKFFQLKKRQKVEQNYFHLEGLKGHQGEMAKWLNHCNQLQLWQELFQRSFEEMKFYLEASTILKVIP